MNNLQRVRTGLLAGTVVLALGGLNSPAFAKPPKPTPLPAPSSSAW